MATKLRCLQDGYKKLRIFSNAPRSILQPMPTGQHNNVVDNINLFYSLVHCRRDASYRSHRLVPLHLRHTNILLVAVSIPEKQHDSQRYATRSKIPQSCAMFMWCSAFSKQIQDDQIRASDFGNYRPVKTGITEYRLPGFIGSITGTLPKNQAFRHKRQPQP
jgi:hypothetical protein